MHKLSRRAIHLFPVVLLAAAFGLVQAQAKPNFSGTWKENVSKSDHGPLPAPESDTHTITHEEPNLKINIASSGQMGDMKYDIAYTTDGKECTNSVNGNDFKSTVAWDGDALVIDTKGKFGETDFTAKDRWGLSEDGKTLTITRHLTSAMGEADQKIIYEKQ